MDKQKQIEEMAKAYCQNPYKCGVDCYPQDGCELYVICTELYNAGYRKINEGAVVIPKKISCYENIEKAVRTFSLEEKKVDFTDEQIMALTQIFAFKEKQENDIRKETAEKFAERLKEKLNEWLEDNEDLNGKIDFGIAMIELIGVKSLDGEVIAESLIDEICKEITEAKV